MLLFARALTRMRKGPGIHGKFTRSVNVSHRFKHDAYLVLSAWH
jgi:hypothetical protein